LFDVTDRFRLHFNYCTTTISRGEKEEKERERKKEKKRTSIHSLVLSRFALERKREGEKIQSKDTNDCSMHHHHHHHHYYRCCTTTKTRRNAAFI